MHSYGEDIIMYIQTNTIAKLNSHFLVIYFIFCVALPVCPSLSLTFPSYGIFRQIITYISNANIVIKLHLLWLWGCAGHTLLRSASVECENETFGIAVCQIWRFSPWVLVNACWTCNCRFWSVQHFELGIFILLRIVIVTYFWWFSLIFFLFMPFVLFSTSRLFSAG